MPDVPPMSTGTGLFMCAVCGYMFDDHSGCKCWRKATDLRCDVTSNLCGTDTRPVVDGKLLNCECAPCAKWLSTWQSTFTFEKEPAQ